jgi:ElaB/YqjD/DUF883 family membrane-anchored ribosome-binding protein
MGQSYRKHFVLLLITGLLVLFPINASALPVAEYHNNLQRAITALDTLSQYDEEESFTDYESRFSRTINLVRTAIPEHQSVELGNEVCNVDNALLHKALEELRQSSAEERSERLQRLIQSLKAIEERVAEQQRTAAMDSKEESKKKLESILARAEYVTGARGPNALTRLIQDFLRWLERFLPKRRSVDPGRASTFTFVAQILVLAIALLALLYVVKILLTRFKGTRRQKAAKKREPRIVLGERLEPESSANDLLSEAEALARRGDLRAAIRKAYIALLVELGDRKLISLAQHKTNRDYLRSVSNLPQLHTSMKRLTDSFERHWYGFAQASENDWSDFRARYQEALQTGN